jgi:hypothetical protein
MLGLLEADSYRDAVITDPDTDPILDPDPDPYYL